MSTRTFEQRRAARIKRSLTSSASYAEVEHYMAVIRNARDGLTAALRAMLDRVVSAMEDGSLPVALLTMDIGSCHCLCGAHNRATGGICDATADYVITLIGGIVSPSERPMCKPCAQWWYEHKAERVEMFTRIDTTATQEATSA